LLEYWYISFIDHCQEFGIRHDFVSGGILQSMYTEICVELL